MDLGTGLDFGPEGNVFATFTHIQHAPFTYRINVKNDSGTIKRGTVRIFLGPKTDESGNTLPFREQRRLMIEMDKFTVNCKCSPFHTASLGEHVLNQIIQFQ